MHLLIPFAAALSDAATQVVRDLPLPQLAKLLATLSASDPITGDEPTQIAQVINTVEYSEKRAA